MDLAISSRQKIERKTNRKETLKTEAKMLKQEVGKVVASSGPGILHKNKMLMSFLSVSLKSN
jgi:hypothetical protein